MTKYFAQKSIKKVQYSCKYSVYIIVILVWWLSFMAGLGPKKNER